MLLEVLNTYMVYHMRVLFIEILNHPIFFSEMTYGLKLRVLDWFVLLLQNICWLLILAVTEVCNTFWSWEYHLSREMVQNNAYKAGKTSNGSWWNNWVQRRNSSNRKCSAAQAGSARGLTWVKSWTCFHLLRSWGNHNNIHSSDEMRKLNFITPKLISDDGNGAILW